MNRLWIALTAAVAGCTAPQPPLVVTDPDPGVKIPAYKEAVKVKDLSAAKQMVIDLDSDDPAVRFYAIGSLQRLTGQSFDYHYYDDEDARQPRGSPLAGLGERTRRVNAMQTADPSAVQVSHPSASTMRIRLLSHPATLAPLRKAFEAFTEKAGFDETERGQLILVVNEAVANCIRHAYDNATDKPIEILAEDAGDELKIVIRDWGKGKTPDLSSKKLKDPNTPGGLGLMCLKQFMSDVAYHPEPDGVTLTMVRRKGHRP